MTKTQLILLIIQAALTALEAIPITAPEAALAATFLKIYQNASALYAVETGQPFSASLIQPETKVA